MDHMELTDIIAVGAVVLWFPLAVAVGIVAHKRGRFGYIWFLLSVFLTPVVTGPILLVLPRQSRVAIEPETLASPKLRLTFIIVAIAMLALWGWSLIPPIQNWGNPNEDGFSYVNAFYGTLICLPAGLLLFAGAIAGRGRHVVRARSALLIGGVTLFVVVAFLTFQYINNSMDLGLG